MTGRIFLTMVQLATNADLDGANERPILICRAKRPLDALLGRIFYDQHLVIYGYLINTWVLKRCFKHSLRS